tara:strand:+ start:392 stop:1135 length:744 start_codon:yes stop_codon:yes gene_type:complete
MNKIYIFDVDGTLTPSRQSMTEEFKSFFNEWSKKNFFFLVSGSDLDKIKEQISPESMSRALGVFCCAGNTLYINNELQYENKFKVPENLKTYLGEKLRMSDYPVKAGNHIEDRGSMLNFSIVGRNCTQVQRNDYYEYDRQVDERKDIAKYITETWSGIDAVVGGQISIDIYPEGNDKSQILYYIEKILQTKVQSSYHAMQYHFIGDKTEEGGNDYSLAKVMEERNDSQVHQTNGWKHTQKILESLIG